MKKIIESKLVKWLAKFAASILIVGVGFLLLAFFPKDADEIIDIKIYKGSLGGAVILLACLGLAIDGIRAAMKKQP